MSSAGHKGPRGPAEDPLALQATIKKIAAETTVLMEALKNKRQGLSLPASISTLKIVADLCVALDDQNKTIEDLRRRLRAAETPAA